MGKIILGTSEVNKIYLGDQEVSKVYLGDVEVWSANSLPDWLLYQNELLPLIEALPKYSDYYVDIAYEISSSPVIRFEYYRVFTSTLTPCQLVKSSNKYSVLQVPYNDTYRGFSVSTLFKPTDNRSWYLAENTTNQDRGGTEFVNSTFVHRAIIQSTIPQFTNATGDSFEDYR